MELLGCRYVYMYIHRYIQICIYIYIYYSSNYFYIYRYIHIDVDGDSPMIPRKMKLLEIVCCSFNGFGAVVAFQRATEGLLPGA